MAYDADEEREDIVDELFNAQVKGKVDPVWRLQRQLERCNILLGTGDIEVFQNSVLALKGDLPMGIKAAVISRSGDYNSNVVKYDYEHAGPTRLGTVANPLVRVRGHPEWGSMMDIPQSFRDEHEDLISIWSPIKVEGEETDYIDLFEIIKEEIEKGGASWQYEKRTLKFKETQKFQEKQEVLPKKVISAIVRIRTLHLLHLRRLYPDLKISYREMNIGWDTHPKTPKYPKKEE